MEIVGFYFIIYYLITIVGAFFLPDPSNEKPIYTGVAWCYVGWIPILFMALLYKSTMHMAGWHFTGKDIPYNWKEFLEEEE